MARVFYGPYAPIFILGQPWLDTVADGGEGAGQALWRGGGFPP